MKTKKWIRINTKKKDKLIISLEKKIRHEVIGQPRAIEGLLQVITARKLKDKNRPIGGFIFAGPTGVGKTMLAKIFARYFLEGEDKYRNFLTRIDGSTISKEHEISKLTGAPPGYVGYDEPPILLQENIDAYHFDIKARKDKACSSIRNKCGTLARLFKNLQKIESSKDRKLQGEHLEQAMRLNTLYEKHKPYYSIVLFDEIEKAHRKIWNILLQVMEESELQLGNGTTTNFSNSVIILTTNIGQRNIQEMLKGGIGFTKPLSDIKDQKIDQKIYEAVKFRIQKEFPPELFKRLYLIVFRPLQKRDFEEILENFLIEEEIKIKKQIRQIYKDECSIEIKYSAKAKKFLLKKGVDIHYGARTLRSVVEKYIRVPVANGLANKEIKAGDKILVDEHNGKLIFSREPRKSGRKKKINRPTREMVFYSK